MLIEIFIVFQVIAFVMCVFAYWRQHPILWAIAGLITAMLAVSAFGVEYRSIVVENSTSMTDMSGNSTFISFNYGDKSTFQYDYPMFGLNMGLFLMSLVYFFATIFEEYQQAQ